MKGLASLLVVALAFMPFPAAALCSDADLPEDFREADIVARVRVVSENRVADDEPSASFVARWGDYSPVVLDRLRVVETFKGRPGPSIRFFQTIDSGRYDLELGEEYLIFLHYYRPYPGSGSIVRGAMYVKHACGQSEEWSKVSQSKLAAVRRLSSRPR
jgi:hypothetical protein